MALDIERLSDREEAISLAPVLAELQEADLVALPHYRPVGAEEIVRFVQTDRRFSERAIIVARRDGEPKGWCHLEPPTTARTAGDIYPLVGGQAVFQPGLPHARADAEHADVVRGLLYACCQARAQQGQRHVEVYAPLECGSEGALRAAGFQPADNWATYLSTLGDGVVGRSPLSVSAVREPELDLLPPKLRELGLIQGEFTPDDLRQLIESFPGFTCQGLLIAERSGEMAGYAAAMVDAAYVSATDRRRAWVGFGPLGMGVLSGGEQEDWVSTLISATSISAFCRGATELAFVGSAEGRQPAVWGKLGFAIEVRWRRWRTDL